MAVTNLDNILSLNEGKTEKQLICSNKPLLHEIEKMYGTDCIKSIIAGYLFKFQALLSIKDESKLDDSQISICADNIIPFVRGLTIGEIAIMFKRFLSGEFGKFYGQIDIMLIGEWVREFKRKRGKLILKNRELRKFVVQRDQNYNIDRVSWRDENKQE